MRKLIFVSIMIVLMCTINRPVYATAPEETTSVILEETSPESASEGSMIEFSYMTDVQDSAVTLTKIYNLLLTMFYFMIILTGYNIIIRNMRKGRISERNN